MDRSRKRCLSLDRLMIEMGAIAPSELGIEELQELVRRLHLGDDAIRARIRFADDSYARNLVCRTPHFDMLVLCWKPGQVTTIHDHMGSLNVTRVYSGTLTSRVFEEVARPGPGRVLVRERIEERLGGGELASVDIGEIHQLANTSTRDLVTVHVYSRPLKDITVYCPASGEVSQVPVRFTREEDLAEAA